MSTSNTRGGPVGKPSVRSAWHAARDRRVIWVDDKDDKGKKIGRHKVIKMNDGPSMKVWAEEQIKNHTADADICSAWFAQKSAERNYAAKGLRRTAKGAIIDAQKRAPRTGLKGHKKGSGGKKGADGGAKEKKGGKGKE